MTISRHLPLIKNGMIGSANEDSIDRTLNVRLPGSYVVSRFSDGMIASKLEDLYWDWSPYLPRGREAKLSFNYWIQSTHRYQSLDTSIPLERQTMVADLQHIMALVIFTREGPRYSYKMLHAFLSHLKKIALYCEKNDLAVHQFFGDETRLQKYGRKIVNGTLARFSGLLAILTQLDWKSQVGFYVAAAPLLRELRKRVVDIINSSKQTPPIPTRIYSHVIVTLKEEIKEFDEIASSYLGMIREGLKRSEEINPKRSEWKNVTRDIINATPKLREYFEKKNLLKDPKGVLRGLLDIQTTCTLMIHTFSGMRHDEALMLPYQCVEIEKSKGQTHYIFCGHTTKLNNGKIHRTKWVTNEDGYRAAELAKMIATEIYRSLDVDPSQTNELINEFPLFISASYFGFGTQKPERSTNGFRTQQILLNEATQPRLHNLLCKVISEEDIVELEAIDPARAWRDEEKFAIGSPWPLQTHQLRRSLALYAQRSGLVSLPSLRRQLQHITREMTRYYAEGSTFAIDLIDAESGVDTKHIASEWRKTKPLSEALSYIRDVLFTDEELFGGAGTFEQEKIRRGEVTNRKTTLARFQRGEIAYKETALGGCIKVGECDQVGLAILNTECLQGCANMIGKMSRLQGAIRHQRHLIANLNPDSVEYRMECSDLEALCATENSWRTTSNRRRNVKST